MDKCYMLPGIQWKLSWFKQVHRIIVDCDIFEIRRYLRNITFIDDLINTFKLKKPIIFLDEVQRLDNPGLFLKSIVDLKLPIKLMASGSSQLEIRSSSLGCI